MKLLLLTFCFLPTLSWAEAPDSSWLNLLANDSLSQWKSQNGKKPPSGWVLNKGVLHFDPSHGTRGSIFTRSHYQHFELQFEWKISKAGNSGVIYRSTKGRGLEYQILDDQHHRDRQNANHRAASLYDLAAAPDNKPLKPYGQWNKSRILLVNNRLEHWLNGSKVVAMTIGSENWNKRFQASKYRKLPNFGTKPGPILLQDHSDPVWFRHIRIRSIHKNSDTPSKP